MVPRKMSKRVRRSRRKQRAGQYPGPGMPYPGPGMPYPGPGMPYPGPGMPYPGPGMPYPGPGMSPTTTRGSAGPSMPGGPGMPGYPTPMPGMTTTSTKGQSMVIPYAIAAWMKENQPPLSLPPGQVAPPTIIKDKNAYNTAVANFEQAYGLYGGPGMPPPPGLAAASGKLQALESKL